MLSPDWLQDVHWGELDYLVIDTPPGTSDEHISIAQFLKGADVDGAVIVTTPQDVAIIDVRKEVNFCKKVASMSAIPPSCLTWLMPYTASHICTALWGQTLLS